MKYLKYFKTETEAEYTAYKDSEDFIVPNVSYVVDNPKPFYNPLIVESYKMVDLGLPSGLKWADRNVGAASPADAGLYFAWGETVGYTAEQVEAGDKVFDGPNYFDTTDGGFTFNKYTTDKLTILESIDDAATVNMGSNWRMPTIDEIQELIDNTTVTFIDLDGNEFSQSDAESGVISEGNLKGVKFTGLNDNSIFIPASGYCNGAMLEYKEFNGSLWSSSLNNSGPSTSSYLYFVCFGNLGTASNERCYGIPVRGIYNK